jgi:FtsP/CotA-like multicopper oxidase with cupredoxin domain
MTNRHISRREFLVTGAVGAGALAFPGALLPAAAAVAAPRFAKVPRFAVQLPIPVKATRVEPSMYHITLREMQQALHPRLGSTTVWGYDDGTLGPLYPGPTIEVQRGMPTTVHYENRLPTNPLPPQTDNIGFKDTVSANPRVVTRIRSPFELPPGVRGTQKYAFHCHILEHEDNDMMRPFEVIG